jgi:hypothetical protein
MSGNCMHGPNSTTLNDPAPRSLSVTLEFICFIQSLQKDLDELRFQGSINLSSVV